jgi:hypothetical protein
MVKDGPNLSMSNLAVSQSPAVNSETLLVGERWAASALHKSKSKRAESKRLIVVGMVPGVRTISPVRAGILDQLC